MDKDKEFKNWCAFGYIAGFIAASIGFKVLKNSFGKRYIEIDLSEFHRF